MALQWKQRQREIVGLASDHLGGGDIVCEGRRDDSEPSTSLRERHSLTRHEVGDHEHQDRHVDHEEKGNQADVRAEGRDAGFTAM